MTEVAAQPAPPPTPEAAQARLSELTKSADFGAKLMAGDVSTRAEFSNLTTLAAGLERRPGAEELHAISENEADARHAAIFVKGVRDDGLDIRDEVLKEAITGAPVSQQDHDLAKQWMARLLASPELSKQLLAGDIAAREQLFRASTILSANIKES
jgi:hypothetical protein